MSYSQWFNSVLTSIRNSQSGQTRRRRNPKSPGRIEQLELRALLTAVTYNPVVGTGNPMDGVDVGSWSEPEFVDIDNDGDLDLFTAAGSVFQYFENTGNATSPTFTQRTGSNNPLNGIAPTTQSMVTFGDIDNDGDFDAAAGGSGAIRFLENTGTATNPTFVQRTGGSNPFNGLSTGGSYAFPAFVNLDGDGDLDLFAGTGNNATFFYFRNNGTATVPAFAAVTGSGNPLDGLAVDSESGYVTPTFGDIDGDGDADLIAGQLNGSLDVFENTGTATVPNFVKLEGSANPLDGVTSAFYSSTALGDIDNDGDLEFMAGGGYGANDGQFLFFEASLPAPAPEITVGDLDYIEGVNGGSPVPIDGAAIASGSGLDGGTLTVQITGNAEAGDEISIGPAFTVTGGDLMSGLTTIGTVTDSSGTANDGIVTGGDLLTITFNANADSALLNGLVRAISYRTIVAEPGENDRTVTFTVTDGDSDSATDTATISVTDLTTLLDYTQRSGAAHPFNSFNLGTGAAPVLGDLDNDGDLDMIAADFNGSFRYFRNDGTNAVPSFAEQTGGSNPLDAMSTDSHPVLTLGDLNNDGDLDLFTGGSPGTFRYFENTGNATSPAFTERTNAANPLNGEDIGKYSAPSLVDIDGDGDLDVFSGDGDGGITNVLGFYENTGNATTPTFVARTGAANPFDGHEIDNDYSVPAFGDLDGDGDFDVFVGDQFGQFSLFENDGTNLLPSFVRHDSFTNPLDFANIDRYSNPALGDLDGDGDLDMVAGKTFNTGMFFYFEANAPATAPEVTVDDLEYVEGVNGGDPVSIDPSATAGNSDWDGGSLTVQITANAEVGDEISIGGSFTIVGGNLQAGGATIGTVTESSGTANDGIVIGGDLLTFTFNANASNATVTDLVRAISYRTTVEEPDESDRTVTFVVQNAALDSATDTATIGVTDLTALLTYTERTGTDNPFDGFDRVNGAAPVLGDLDNDGDLDMIAAAYNGSFHFFRNDGTTADPDFSEQTGGNNPLIGLFSSAHPVLTLGDLNDDGDLDLIVGAGPGTFRYFENTGNATSPAFTEQTGGANPLNGQDVGGYSAPALVDIDGDGDLDLFSGKGTFSTAGLLSFFENTGNATTPTFVLRSGSANPFDGHPSGSVYSAPTFGDLDGDGDFDVIMGGQYGQFRVFENDGTSTSPSFIRHDTFTNPLDGEDIGQYSNPALGDLDGDGDQDLVAAETFTGGAFYYFEAGSLTPPSVTLTLNPTTATEAAGTTITATATADAPVSGDQTVDVDIEIAGSITADDFNVVSGTITILDGQTQGTADFVVQDDAVLEATETATIEISNPSAGLILGTTVSDTVDITDNDNAAVTVEDVTATEGGGLLFTVSLDNAVQGAFDVNVSFTDGSATGGTDFDDTAVTLNFAGNASETHQFTVTTTDDAVVEDTEDFTVNLTATNALVTDSDTATGNITDNDTGTVTIDSVAVDENISGGMLEFTVSLDFPVDTMLAVDVTFAGGTATGGGTDYTSTAQQVIFAPGNTTNKTVMVPIINDAFAEDDETFTASLATVTTLGDRNVILTDTGTGTINNDDGAPELTVSILATEIDENDGTGATTATVSRNTDTTNALEVTLTSSAPGEATVQTTVTIDAGETTSAPFNINAVDEGTVDGDRSVTITASAAGHTSGTDDVQVNDDEVPNLDDVIFYNRDSAVEEDLSPDSSGQRSLIKQIQVTINGNVTVPTGAVSNGSFVAQNLDAASNVGLTVDSSVFSDGITTVVLTFTSGIDGNGSLLDGNYRFRIDGTVLGIDASGNDVIGGAHIVDFHRLFGDSDGDRDVDGLDYGNFYSAFFGEAAYENTFDQDDDDDPLNEELTDFFSNFGTILDPFVGI